MGSVILLSFLVTTTFVVLCYMFNESRVELDSPTIAAMEAHTEALETRRRAEEEAEPVSAVEGEYADEPVDEVIEDDVAIAPPPQMEPPDYEYREMLEEGSGNYVLPQWVVNFFSSSDICHTLDRPDSLVIVARLNDPGNAYTGVIDVSIDCDMTTQTVALKLCFGEGAAAETFQTKFYLFERGDLFELCCLVRRQDIRIDFLTRGTDYTLEYLCTERTTVPQSVLTHLKSVLSKIPG